VREESVQENWL